MNCPLDLGQSLLAYKHGLRGYEKMKFNLRNYVATDDTTDLPYIYGSSFLPCSSRKTQQFSACDYDRDKIDYDTSNPIMFAPLPFHKFHNAGLIIKARAGFSGVSKPAETSGTALLRLRFFEVVSGKKFEPKVTIVTEEVQRQINGSTVTVTVPVDYKAEAADPESYSHVAGTYARRSIPANTNEWFSLSTEAFLLIPHDDENKLKQYFVAPSISLTGGVKCATAYLDVEIFHNKM